MEKHSVIEILMELNFKKEGDPDNRKGVYDLYTDGVTNIWLGNWYIENENKPLAFPYKEKQIKEEELIQFIKNEYNGW